MRQINKNLEQISSQGKRKHRGNGGRRDSNDMENNRNYQLTKETSGEVLNERGNGKG